VKQRDQQIIRIHRDITLVSQINEEISIMIHSQGAGVEKIEQNIDKSNEKLKQANKELLKKGERGSINKKKWLKTMACMVVFIFFLVLMVYYK